MESTCISSSTSLDDRTELVHGELYREIKKNLHSDRKDDLATRDQDVFDEGLASAEKPRKERGD